MMNRNGLFTAKIRQPAKPKTQWSTWFPWLFYVLMKTLKRSNRETFRRHQLRLTHHLPLVCAVTVQRDQQRRGPRSSDIQIVIKIDPCRERAVNVWINARHWALILFILCSVSIASLNSCRLARSEEHTSELQSPCISYAVFCLNNQTL